MSTDLHVVGRSVPRSDGAGHVTGMTRFTTDRTFPGMLHLKVVRSPVHHARVRGLDLSEADLHGASLHEARISGVFFPANLAPEEIRLSVLLGTRMRTRAADRVPS
jgi:hypothetical protein